MENACYTLQGAAHAFARARARTCALLARGCAVGECAFVKARASAQSAPRARARAQGVLAIRERLSVQEERVAAQAWACAPGRARARHRACLGRRHRDGALDDTAGLDVTLYLYPFSSSPASSSNGDFDRQGRYSVRSRRTERRQRGGYGAILRKRQVTSRCR